MYADSYGFINIIIVVVVVVGQRGESKLGL